MSDGGLRRSEAADLTWGDVAFREDGTARITIRKGKNQVQPLTVAVTETTTNALCEIQPNTDVDPAASVFGLTGETLANRVRAAAKAAGLALIHRTTACGRSAEEARGCASESGIMVLKQKTDPRKGAPNSNCLESQQE